MKHWAIQYLESKTAEAPKRADYYDSEHQRSHGGSGSRILPIMGGLAAGGLAAYGLGNTEMGHSLMHQGSDALGGLAHSAGDAIHQHAPGLEHAAQSAGKAVGDVVQRGTNAVHDFESAHNFSGHDGGQWLRHPIHDHAVQALGMPHSDSDFESGIRGIANTVKAIPGAASDFYENGSPGEVVRSLKDVIPETSPNIPFHGR